MQEQEQFTLLDLPVQQFVDKHRPGGRYSTMTETTVEYRLSNGVVDNVIVVPLPERVVEWLAPIWAIPGEGGFVRALTMFETTAAAQAAITIDNLAPVAERADVLPLARLMNLVPPHRRDEATELLEDILDQFYLNALDNGAGTALDAIYLRLVGPLRKQEG